MDTVGHLGALPHQPAPATQAHGLLSLLDGLRMDLGDEARETHASPELGVDIITLPLRWNLQAQLSRLDETTLWSLTYNCTGRAGGLNGHHD